MYNIPSELIIKCLSNGYMKYFRLYLMLKANCDGHLTLTKDVKNKLISRLKISTRTLYRQLKWLIDANWVGKNEESKKYYIRSFVTICKIEKVKHIQCYKFNTEQLNILDKFAFACAISDIIKYKKKQEWMQSYKSGRRFKSPHYFQISISYVSTYCNIGKNKCVQLMKNNKYLSKKKNLTTLFSGSKTIENKCFAIANKYNTENYVLRGKQGVLVTSNPNLFKSKLESMKRRNF